MLINNRTTRFLNGHFIFFGFLFLLPGIYRLFKHDWIFSGINLFISWFLFASYSGVQIDTEQRIFREYNSWFGLLRTGKWKNLDNYLGVTLVPMNSVFRMYSRSNRTNTSAKKEFRIYLVNKVKQPAVALKKCKTHEQAQTSLDELALWLKMPVFSIKK